MKAALLKTWRYVVDHPVKSIVIALTLAVIFSIAKCALVAPTL